MATDRQQGTVRPGAPERRTRDGWIRPALAAVTPGRAIALLGAGHAVWGALAYRRELTEIAACPVDAVGDGLFNPRHARDGRAAAFWFMFTAPLVVLCGRLSDAALRAGDHRSAAAAGRTVIGISLLGLVVIPRSGFPAALPAGWLLVRRAREAQRLSAGADDRP